MGPAIGAYAIGADVAATYLPWLVAGTIICVLLCFAAVTYRVCRTLLDKDKTIRQNADAVYDLVDLARRSKKHLTAQQTETIFGDAGIAATWLSPATEDLIEPIRRELGDKPEVA